MTQLPETIDSAQPEVKRELTASEIAVEAIQTLATVILLYSGIHTFILENRFIPSSSMEPTLQIKDRLVIEKISYYFRKPVRGEIIVFHPPNHPAIPNKNTVYIKRLIGTPGDWVGINDGKVYINGKPLTETYIQAPPAYYLPATDPALCPGGCYMPPEVQAKDGIPSFKVPEGSYWVMGDNRNNSLDSHVWGFVPAQNVVGRASFRYWPLDKRTGTLNTPEY